MKQTVIVDVQSDGERLDVFLSHHFPRYSRNQIKKAIQQGLVAVDDEYEDPDYHVQEGEIIEFTPPSIHEVEQIKPEKIPLKIIYEDENFLVINKEAGMVMHPGAGNWKGTLANAVLGYLEGKEKIDVSQKPLRAGIVHRLDKDTTGLVLVAKNLKTQEYLQRLFKEKKITKKYYGLVWGELEAEEGIINAPIGRHRVDPRKFTITERGKEAVTHYIVTQKFTIPNFQFSKTIISLLEITPQTGRTHQIRVHLSKLKHPIVGDTLYTSSREYRLLNSKFGVKRQMLHAYYLKLKLPDGEIKEFQSELPHDFQSIIKRFS